MVYTMIYLLRMVIFYGYVKLLEGILHNMVIVVYLGYNGHLTGYEPTDEFLQIPFSGKLKPWTTALISIEPWENYLSPNFRITIPLFQWLKSPLYPAPHAAVAASAARVSASGYGWVRLGTAGCAAQWCVGSNHIPDAPCMAHLHIFTYKTGHFF